MKFQMKKTEKPSFHKYNEPYRGVTSSKKFLNTILEVARDIIKLCNITEGRPDKKGLRSRITDKIQNARKGKGVIQDVAVSHIRCVNRSEIIAQPEIWQVEKCITRYEDGNIVASTNGINDNAKLFFSFFGKEKDAVYLRVKVKSNVDADGFAIGSDSVKQQDGSIGALKTFALKKDVWRYVDTFIDLTQTETTNISIHMNREASELKAIDLTIESIEIYKGKVYKSEAKSHEETIREVREVEGRIKNVR